jgi:hypothetical protein
VTSLTEREVVSVMEPGCSSGIGVQDAPAEQLRGEPVASRGLLARLRRAARRTQRLSAPARQVFLLKSSWS